MFQKTAFASALLFLMSIAPVCSAADLYGFYLETRTCEVYTGPCFANAEVGIAGKDAIMAWKIEDGSFEGVDLSGLSVVMVLKTEKTLGFRGIRGAGNVKSVLLIDEKANDQQQQALIRFAKKQSDKAGQHVARVDITTIAMNLDYVTYRGQVKAGKSVLLSTRPAVPSDCVCSNESAYYPPLTKVDQALSAVALEGQFTGRGLGTRWSTPNARSAFVATFSY